MKNTVKRLFAFISGDQMKAEELNVDSYPMVPWVFRARADERLATYAVEVASRSATFANEAVARIQEKASSTLSFTLTLIPVAGVAAGAALVIQDTAAWNRWTAFSLFAAVMVLLIVAALRAFLASGSVAAISVNLERLSADLVPKVAELKAAEADAWNASAALAMETATKKSADFFAARRLTIIALIIATIGAGFLGAARFGPHHADTPASSNRPVLNPSTPQVSPA